MYNGVGLCTPRGSGTSGYIQRHFGALKPKRSDIQQGRTFDDSRNFDTSKAPKIRKPNAELLEHERRRKVEVQLVIFRDQLEADGLIEVEIEERVKEERQRLLDESAEESQKEETEKCRQLERKGYVNRGGDLIVSPARNGMTGQCKEGRLCV